MNNENCLSCIHKNVCDLTYKEIYMAAITFLNDASPIAKEKIEIKARCKEYMPIQNKLSDEELLADHYELGITGKYDARNYVAGFCRCGCSLYRKKSKASVGWNPITCPNCGYGILVYASKEFLEN